MKAVLMLLFLCASAIHLYFCWKDDHHWRVRTKPFLLFFLLMFYCCAADNVNPLIAGALFFSWVGDVLLIPRGTKWFISGGVSFLISHVLFISTYCRLVHGLIRFPVILIMAVLYSLLTFLVMQMIWLHVSSVMRILLMLYLLINGLMNVFAFMRLIACPGTGSLISYIGAVFFFISDAVLFLLKYHPVLKQRKRKNFAIMITYLIGELLITVGLLNA